MCPEAPALPALPYSSRTIFGVDPIRCVWVGQPTLLRQLPKASVDSLVLLRHSESLRYCRCKRVHVSIKIICRPHSTRIHKTRIVGGLVPNVDASAVSIASYVPGLTSVNSIESIRTKTRWLVTDTIHAFRIVGAPRFRSLSITTRRIWCI